ncbi:hypothetical protein Gpo141_00008844 [Globisporangium polare]
MEVDEAEAQTASSSPSEEERPGVRADVKSETAAERVAANGVAHEHPELPVTASTKEEPREDADSAEATPAEAPESGEYELEQEAAANASKKKNVDNATGCSEEEIPIRRLTRNRASLLLLDESDTESDKSGGRQRTRRQWSQQQQQASKSSNDAKTPSSGKKKASGKARSGGRKGDGSSSESDDDGTPGEYIPVQVGDCVLLDSGDPENHYIALVSSVQRSQNLTKQKDGSFTAQWYYKPDDIRQEVRNLIVGGVLEEEVFLSPHKDKNSIDAVVGLCNVVSPEEYDAVQSEIKRGFREKTKPYYICRYKYYPGRPIKRALEVVKNDAIRSGLGPMKPKIGEQHQAPVPEWVEPEPQPVLEKAEREAALAAVPWKTPEPPRTSRRYSQVWSPLVLEHQSLAFHQFQQVLVPLKFAVGNVLKFFNRDAKVPGHVRCIIMSHVPSDHIQICLSTGQVQAVLPSEVCSPLGDDVAMTYFYRSRFNLCEAIRECADVIVRAQQKERDAFRKEVVEFSQLAFREEQELAASAAIEAAGIDLTEEEDEDQEQDEELPTTRKRRR